MVIFDECDDAIMSSLLRLVKSTTGECHMERVGLRSRDANKLQRFGLRICVRIQYGIRTGNAAPRVLDCQQLLLHDNKREQSIDAPFFILCDKST